MPPESSATVPRETPASASAASVIPTLLIQLQRNAERHGGEVAMRERDLGIWREYTWREYRDEVLAFAAGLEALGFRAGEALTVIGDNRPRLYFGCLGVAALRGFAIPVFPDVTPEELVQYTRHGRPRFALAEDQEQTDKLLALRERTGIPETIVYDDGRGIGIYKNAGLLPWETVVEKGRQRLAAEPGLAEALLGRAQPEDPVVLLYSSGTTGTPKGIPLKHRHIVGAVANAAQTDYFKEGEEYVAYLPMAWVGDFVFTLGAGIALRFRTNIPERQETVMHDLREVAPTFYLAAPRSWDQMLTNVQVGIEESTPVKRRLFHFFMPLAMDLERARIAGKRAGLGRRLLRACGEPLVYGPIKDYLGLTRAAHAYTAGEAIGEDTFLFFRALGVNLRQFYGQTEATALTAAQRPDAVRLHTVGFPLPGVDLRIGESGEILVRSAGVFDGYMGDPQATAKTLEGGWLHTGDAGYLEADGQLVVLGRVSEVVYTSKGERFIPNYIENRIKFSPYIRNVAVLGAGREYLTAIVCIDMEAVGHWAQAEGIPYVSYADLSQKPEAYDLIAGSVAHVNSLLPPGLAVRRFVNLHKDFDADDGEITRTRKLRRSVIETRYAALVAALYSGAGAAEFDAQITYESGATSLLRRRLTIREVA